MFSNSASKLPKDEFNNSGSFPCISDTSSMPDSIAHQIMNRAFVVIVPRVMHQHEYNLSPYDYDTLQTFIENPPKPNASLQQLFNTFLTKKCDR